MMSAKWATAGLFKIKLFLDNGYDAMIFTHDVTKKVLSHDSNYTV